MEISRTFFYAFAMDTTQRRSWTRFLGRRRLTELERALTDPELVSLRQELAVVDMRIAELRERTASGEGRRAWGRLRRRLEVLQIHIGEAKWDRVQETATEMKRIIEDGATDYERWQEIESLLELRRKLADTERKYEELHQLAIPAAQLGRLFDDLLRAVETIIPDRGLQRRLLAEVLRMSEADRAASHQSILLPAAFSVAVSTLSSGREDSDALEATVEDERDSPDRAEIPLPGDAPSDPSGGVS